MMTLGLVLCLLVTASLARSDTWGSYTFGGDGFSRFAHQGKIINGESGDIAHYPYMVALIEVVRPGAVKYFCGGSIISDSWVLSAAHCGEKFEQIQVIINAGSSIWNKGRSFRYMAKYIKHQNYPQFNLNLDQDEAPIANDIMVIKVTKPFKWSTTVQKIGLPTSLTHPWKTGVLTGWGYTSVWKDAEGKLHGKGTLQLMTTSVVKQDMRYCQDLTFQKEGMMCATHNTHGSPSSACWGDSGGPLVSTADLIQVGVVSSGSEDCSPGEGVLYTDVAFYRQWIRVNTGI